MTVSVIKQNGDNPSKSERTSAWTLLQNSLPKLDDDSRIWWQLTGGHLAALIEAAGYPAERQYEVLLFHYKWTIPYMSAAPNGSPQHWRSTLQLDGTPIEYSWKWNSTTGLPDVQYLLEPIGRYAGTGLDPLNQDATRELLHRLAKRNPGSVELGWTDHFLAELFDHDRSKYQQEKEDGAHITSSLFVAIELLEKGAAFKTYFYPRTIGQPGLMAIERWEQAISRLDPKNAARAVSLEFLANNQFGKLFKPFCLSVDNISPAKARLKWYFNSPRTSFASIRETMSLDGRISTPHFEKQLADLCDLIRTLAKLPADWPDDEDVPTATPRELIDPAVLGNFKIIPDLLSGNLYFFDIAPDKALPEIRFYTPVRNFGRDDLSIAQSLSGWMEARGRGQFGESYIKALHAISSHRHLHSEPGLQTFLSCQFKGNGELDVTSYLNPQAFHPERLAAQRNSRLKRGDTW